jgi:microcystin-dependent protein
MTNQTQDSLSSPQSSYLEAIFDPFDGSSKLLSTISSANFNGAIPDLVIQYPDAVTDDLIPGRFFLITDTYYLITRVDENIDPITTDTISYNVWYTAGGVERYKTILNGVKVFTDGTELQIRKDDWDNKSIGSSGWTITTEGNSVFSNVAVRGTIEATDGYFDGFLVIGDPNDPEFPGSMKIGTNVNSTNDGIYINANNYWYDTGLFKIGNATKNVVWDNNDLSVTGDINATGGVFSGKVRIGNMYLGVDASPTLEDGIYIDGSNYWYDDGSFSLGTGTNTISFNGSNIIIGTGVNIAGEISANSLLLTSGSFSMSIKSNHTPVTSSIRNITKVILSGTSPQLAEFTTSSSHPFVEGDFIYVSGLSNSGGGLGSLNKVFQVSSVSSNIINVNASSSTKLVTVNADNEDTTLSVISSSGVFVGMAVSGTGIQSGTTVVSTTATEITISNPTTQALSDASITFSPINGTYDSTDAGWTNGEAELSYDGIFVNTNNYWYSNGLFGIGDGTKGLTWNGSSLNVTGVINASAGGTMAGWEIGTDEIFKGTGASKIALNAGANPKIYIGSGFHSSAGTGFYVDSTGKFSLSNLLTFSPSVDIPEATTTGTFNSGTNTITVTSASGIVRGMTVLGTGIASNSTVTNISGTTITTSNNATANGTGVSLTFILDDFSELQVNGRIKGVLESTSSIVTPRLATTATSVVVSGSVGSQIATITTTGHAFITGEKILIENLPATNGLNNLNREFAILSITDSITLVISLSGITGVTSSTNTSLTGLINLRELTMGLHPAQGTESYAHNAGTGIRLDKFNWWFTNNQFRVGSIDSYIKWTTDPTPLLDVVGQIRATSGYIGGTDSGWEISSGLFKSITNQESKNIHLDAGVTLSSNPSDVLKFNPKIYIGADEWNGLNTPFYTDSSGYFSVGSGDSSLTYDPTLSDKGLVTVTGKIQASSGYIGGKELGWQFGNNGILQTGEGAGRLALASSVTQFSGGLATINIERILVDDEFEDYEENFASVYVTVATSGFSAGMQAQLPDILFDTIMKFDFQLLPTSNLKSLFDGKSIPVTDVLERQRVFFVKEIDNYDPDGGFPEISSPQATVDIYPVYGSATTTQLLLYFTEIFTDDEFTTSTGGLAVGNTLVLEEDVLPGVAAGNYVIAAIGTQDLDEGTILYGEADGYNARFGRLTLTRSGSAISLQESSGGGLSLLDTAGYYTLVFYPEDTGIVVHDSGTEGFYSYTTTKPKLSFYDELAEVLTSDGYYYMWAGADDPDLASFAIKKSNAVGADNLTIQNKALGQSYASQALETTFAPFTAKATGISGSSFVPMVKSRVGGATKTRISVLGQIHNTDNTIHTVLHNLNSSGTEDHKFYFRNDGILQAPEFLGKGAVPVGSIVMWYTATPPAGWLFCNGQAVDSGLYPQLRAIMATTPNLTGRFPLGAGGTIGAALGATGGAASATYTTVTAHSHTLNAFNVSITEGTVANNNTNHSHGVVGNSSIAGNTDSGSRGISGTTILTPTVNHAHGDGNYGTTSAGGTTETDHSHSINAFNGSITEGTNDNNTAATSTVATVPPYVAVNFIIYAG